MPTEAEIKAQKYREERRRYFAFLDKRIPELHKAGDHPGRAAREQADKEWAQAA